MIDRYDAKDARKKLKLAALQEARPEHMTTYFVSRHPGAVAWAARRGLAVDAYLAHLDPQQIQPGDTVIGILPVHLAARRSVVRAPVTSTLARHARERTGKGTLGRRARSLRGATRSL